MKPEYYAEESRLTGLWHVYQRDAQTPWYLKGEHIDVYPSKAEADEAARSLNAAADCDQ